MNAKSLVLLPLLLAAPVLALQDGGGHARPAAARTSEDLLLDAFVGEWTTETTMTGNPWAPSGPMKGRETTRLVLGGRWLLQEVRGDDFEGLGLVGYDREKEAWVSVWVSSRDPGLTVSEGSFDPETHTLELHSEGDDFQGRPTTWRNTMRREGERKVETVAYRDPQGAWVEAIRVESTPRGGSDE